MNSKTKVCAAVVGILSAGIGHTGLAQESVSSNYTLEQIVVTATKRETTLNDTAISLAAISSEDIDRKNIEDMDDYLRTVPGVNYVDLGSGVNGTVVRGLSASVQTEVGGRAAVYTYLGDVPLTGTGWQGSTPDLKMVDLDRVEVLRGPQGTLFGAGSFAGAVRNIVRAPQLDIFEGSVKASLSSTSGPGSTNNRLEAVLNVPLVDDVLALRAVTYRHDDSGFIDNVAGNVREQNGFVTSSARFDDFSGLGGGELYVNQSDVGRVETSGARISLLWEPTEELSVNLMYIYQEGEQIGKPNIELLNENLSNSNYAQTSISIGLSDIPEVRGNDVGHQNEVNLTNLIVEYDLGWASLLSSTAWIDANSEDWYDLTGANGLPAAGFRPDDSKRFVEELRLTSQLDGPFQYLVGAYYEESESSSDYTLWLLGQTLIGVVGNTQPRYFTQNKDNTIDQFALFGELSYEINDQFELTLGARNFDYTTSRYEDEIIFESGVVNVDFPYKETSERDTVFKANLSYMPTDDTLLYAQWSEGFRLGGANLANPEERVPQIVTCDQNNDGILDGTSAAYQPGFDSDRTENFELGAKLTLLDQRLQINASVFQIDWLDLPVDVAGQCESLDVAGAISNLTISLNGGEASSQGFELETIYQLNEALRLNLGVSYTEAEFSQDVPEAGAFSGDRLAGSPKLSYNLGLQYDSEISGYPFYASANYSYIGEFYADIAERGQEVGDYGELRMSMGLTVNDLHIELFANNLTNEDALVHMDFFSADARGYRLRPRTIGVNLRYEFYN
ncbi:MAG: TonB-dependent receptor [Paraglaciecola sp.]|uniref:TonB-dependent receptor n=1 Tax=Paraglaciecola sp. TaxID=1920173 RepID=UPI0032973B1C